MQLDRVRIFERRFVRFPNEIRPLSSVVESHLSLSLSLFVVHGTRRSFSAYTRPYSRQHRPGGGRTPREERRENADTLTRYPTYPFAFSDVCPKETVSGERRRRKKRIPTSSERISRIEEARCFRRNDTRARGGIRTFSIFVVKTEFAILFLQLYRERDGFRRKAFSGCGCSRFLVEIEFTFHSCSYTESVV